MHNPHSDYVERFFTADRDLHEERVWIDPRYSYAHDPAPQPKTKITRRILKALARALARIIQKYTND